MASSLSRYLYRTLLSPPSLRASSPLCTKSFQDAFVPSDPDDPTPLDSEPTQAGSHSDSDLPSAASSSQSDQKQPFTERSLENGLDLGIYKAILVGQVGQNPLQKRLRSGRTVTLLSIGTGGIRNNRRPFDNEEPKEYATRCAVQWHRVSIYPERLGDLAMKNLTPGSVVYVEGNLETKIFSDPTTGLVRRIREVAVRRNGRVVFLGKGSDSQQSSEEQVRSVGYY